MRNLRLVFGSSSNGLPVLLAASLLPAPGCGQLLSDGEGGKGEAAPASGGARVVTPDAGRGGAGGTRSITITAGSSTCPPYTERVMHVGVPDEGTPATPDTVCTAEPPVQSGRAARITLVPDENVWGVASGNIEVARELLGTVVGLPTLEVIDSTNPTELTNLRADGEGFRFDFRVERGRDPTVSVLLRVTLAIQCEDGIQSVVTEVGLGACSWQTNEWPTIWHGPGEDVCCYYLSEVVAHPLPAGFRYSELPLPEEFRVTLRRVLQHGRVLVLQAEHAAGPGRLGYRWNVSGGSLAWVSGDIAAWSLPDGPGPHLIQVAGHLTDDASVASYLYEDPT